MNKKDITSKIKDLIDESFILIKQQNKPITNIGMIIKNKISTKKDILLFLSSMNQSSFMEKLYWIYNDIKEYPKCKYCGKEHKRFINFILGYKECCSKDCTNLLKFGATSNLKNKEIRKNIENKIKQKYGGLGYASKEIFNKTRKTEIKKYGSIFQKTQERKEKIINTNISRYGSDHFMKTENGIKKYLASRNYNDPVFKEKQRALIKNKLDSMAKGQRNSFYSKLEILLKDKFQILFSKEEYKGSRDRLHNETIKYKFKCLTCGNIVLSSVANIRKYNTVYCPFCNKQFESMEENILYDFCKIYFPNAKQHDRSILKKYELDIFIPEIKLAIEYNGVYWHSLNEKEFGYHLNKTNLCEKQDIRLIHIWEDDWNNNKEEIKKKLIEVFENKEIIDYSKILERDWYQVKEISGYNLEILKPEIINRNKFSCENTGYLKYTKI